MRKHLPRIETPLSRPLSPLFWAAGIVLLVPVVVLAGVVALFTIAAPAAARRRDPVAVPADPRPMAEVVVLRPAVARQDAEAQGERRRATTAALAAGM